MSLETSQTFPTCWEASLERDRNITALPFLGSLQILLLTLLFVFGAALNCFAFFLVIRFKTLRTRDFFLALQVLLADLLDISYIPMMIAVLLTSSASISGRRGCDALGFSEVLFDIIRYGGMSVLALDRFNTVFFPFAYPPRGNVTALALSVALWSFGIVYSATAVAVDCYGLQPLTGVCTIYPECSNGCVVIEYLHYVVITVIGVILPTALYSMMSWKARKMKKQTAQVVGSLAMPRSTNTIRDNRAVVTFFILFVALCGCALPIYVGLLLLPVKGTHPTIYWSYEALSHIFLDIVVLLDPIIVMRNQDVREKIQELWSSLKNCLLHRNPRM